MEPARRGEQPHSFQTAAHVRGKRRITTDTALRLSQAFGLSERYWLNIQNDYDIALEHDQHDDELAKVEKAHPRLSGVSLDARTAAVGRRFSGVLDGERTPCPLFRKWLHLNGRES